MPTPGTSTIAGSAPRIGGRVRLGVPLVVGGVVGAVGARAARRSRATSPRSSARRPAGRGPAARTFVRRKWSGHDVPSAARRGISARARKSQHDVLVVEVAHHRRVGGGDAAQDRRQRGGALGAARAAAGARSPATAAPNGSGRPCSAMNASRAADDRRGCWRSHSSLVVAPGGEAVAAEHAADRLRVRRLQLRHVEAELEAGPAPVDPQHLVAEALASSAPARRRRWRAR